jgi:serine phosphatase RsbU (regulator of sigma subunit)
LSLQGPLLGDAVSNGFDSKALKLEAGDSIVWYTDGITECQNEAGETYGDRRFRASIIEASPLDVMSMKDRIVDSSLDFLGTRARADDMTLVVAKIS